MLAALAASAALVNFDAPPKRFRCPVTVTLTIFPPDKIGPYCREWGVDRIDAAGCYVPQLNAIAMTTSDDAFTGRLLIHEAAHACGWTWRHER